MSGKVLPSGVKAYFGIPYAAAPVGDLRWREPQPVQAWKGVYHADRMAPECIQVLRRHDLNHYFGEEATSEDCLYLNIWSSGDAKAGAKLPVIVWIYGGGFTLGSSGMAMYSGENVAKKGAIFVSFNYRVGALGNLAHPELTAESPHHASGDYGFLDQVAALQWVQRNIDKFGGDPGNVTIVGQSAGAMSVSALEASPLAKGLFQRGFAMSLSLFDNRFPFGAAGRSGEDRPRSAESAGRQVRLPRCGSCPPTKSSRCRRTASSAAPERSSSGPTSTAIFFPTAFPISSPPANRTTSRPSRASRATKAPMTCGRPATSRPMSPPHISSMAIRPSVS